MPETIEQSRIRQSFGNTCRPNCTNYQPRPVIAFISRTTSTIYSVLPILSDLLLSPLGLHYFDSEWITLCNLIRSDTTTFGIRGESEPGLRF